MKIYADNAATTKVSQAAIQAMMPYWDGYYGNPSSLHTEGQRAAEALADARRRIAGYLDCAAEELIFTSGGSEADNQAILTAAVLGERRGKKHIVASAFEHHAVLHTLDALKRRGFTVTLVDVHETGVVAPEQVKEALRPDTCLVTVMYANNEIGMIQPIAEIGRLCREAGVLFHTDAVQAVGQLPLSVQTECIDMLSLSAHKFHGPKGIGALYVRKGIRAETLIHGGAQERGRRAGTENLPAVMGMAAALDEAYAALEETTARLLPLRNRLIEGLTAIPHTLLNGDRDKRLPGLVSVCFEGIEGESLLLLLDDKGICASSGSACTSGSLEPSHVLLALGRPHEIAHGSLRLSLSTENTAEEVEYIIRAVTEVVAYLRQMSPVWSDLEAGKREFITKGR